MTHFAPLLQLFLFYPFPQSLESKPDIPFRFKRKDLAEELQKKGDSLSKLEVDR